MHRFRELKVYQKSIELTFIIRSITKKFPKEELFSLSTQFRRATDSISLNIAEGAGNISKKEFAKFISYAIRSGYECVCCLDIAHKNNYITIEEKEKLFQNIDEIIAMLVGLKKSISTQ